MGIYNRHDCIRVIIALLIKWENKVGTGTVLEICWGVIEHYAYTNLDKNEKALSVTTKVKNGQPSMIFVTDLLSRFSPSIFGEKIARL